MILEVGNMFIDEPMAFALLLRTFNYASVVIFAFTFSQTKSTIKLGLTILSRVQWLSY